MNKATITKIHFWQLMALGMALIAYRYMKQAGATSMNGQHMNVDPNKFVDLASRMAPPEWRPQVREVGAAVMDKFLNS
jgi:hypothetical protein